MSRVVSIPLHTLCVAALAVVQPASAETLAGSDPAVVASLTRIRTTASRADLRVATVDAIDPAAITVLGEAHDTTHTLLVRIGQ